MSVTSTVRGMAKRANPAFAAGAVAIPSAAFALAVTVGSTTAHMYVHVMAGVLWTGIDLFMALIIGPVLGALDPEQRANWFASFTPKMTFLMPTLATVTIFGGITLAVRIGYFPNSGPWIALFTLVAFLAALLVLGWVFDAFRDLRWQAAFAIIALVNSGYLASEISRAGAVFPETRTLIVVILAVMVVLVVQGFGFLMPNEVLVYLEGVSERPDTNRIGRLGMRNAKLSGVQGTFQLSIIALMVALRMGWRWTGI